MTPERHNGEPAQDDPQKGFETRRYNTRVALLATIAVAGSAALAFGKGPIGEVGAGIILGIMLAPGAKMAKDIIKSIICPIPEP